jgi:hypothetical protein
VPGTIVAAVNGVTAATALPAFESVVKKRLIPPDSIKEATKRIAMTFFMLS